MGNPRGRYKSEFNLEAIRLVKASQSVHVTAKVLGLSNKSLYAWIKQQQSGGIVGAGVKPDSAEQLETARLGAELARTKVERDIKKSDGVLCKGGRVKHA